MPLDQLKSKLVLKTNSGLVQVTPETTVAAVEGLETELANAVHKTGAESVDGIKTFGKNTMAEAVALSGSEINVTQSAFFTKTISANTTFTFTGAPTGKTCAFTLILTNGGAYDVTWPVNINWMGGQAPTLKEVGIDVLTFFTVNGGTTWMEVSGSISGGSSSGTIADSGVIAGTYGPSANVNGTYSGTFVIPEIGVNQKGQVTQVIERTVTLPASDNTDISVQVTANGWTKSYLLGVDASNPVSGVPLNVTAIADTDIYLGTQPGNLHATTFVGALNGLAAKATGDADGNAIKTTYAKLASPAFTGTPTAPTAAAGTNTGQIATTAFVANAISGLSPSSGGGEGTGTLPDSGVTSGSYGPAADSAPGYGGTFTVPEFIVNQKGQITSASNKTITIPATDNTDTKVSVTLATTAKAYLLGTTTTPTGTAAGVSAVADTGVYLDTTAGTLTATKFVGAAEDSNGNAYATQSYVDTAISNAGTGSGDSGGGTASVYVGATSSANGVAGLVPAATSAQKDNYLKGDGTWGQIVVPTVSNYVGATASASGSAGLVPAATSAEKDYCLKGDGTWGEVASTSAKEIASLDVEPTAANTSDLDNGSLIFWNTGSAQNAPQPVYTTGNQTIGGVKTFTAGIFGGTVAMSGNAIDCAAGTSFTKTISANTTFSFTNVPSDATCCVTLILRNGGNYTVTWPASVKWSEDTIPDLMENGTDVLTFITCDGGVTWYATTTCVGVGA